MNACSGAEWLDAGGNILSATARADGGAWLALSPTAGVVEFLIQDSAEDRFDQGVAEDVAASPAVLQPAAFTRGSGELARRNIWRAGAHPVQLSPCRKNVR